MIQIIFFLNFSLFNIAVAIVPAIGSPAFLLIIHVRPFVSVAIDEFLLSLAIFKVFCPLADIHVARSRLEAAKSMSIVVLKHTDIQGAIRMLQLTLAISLVKGKLTNVHHSTFGHVCSMPMAKTIEPASFVVCSTRIFNLTDSMWFAILELPQVDARL